jgi:hypothetical protein
MTFDEALKPYRDEKTGLVALRPGTSGKTEDNHLGFTATARNMFGGFSEDEFLNMVWACETSPGFFVRYPGETEPTSWDDLLYLSCASPILAEDILVYAERNNWIWQSPSGEHKWLGRVPLLVPVVKAAAGRRLGFVDRVRAAGCFIQNLFEPHGETSGRCMLVQAKTELRDHGWILDLAISLWEGRMRKLYPGGLAELYSIYFQDPEHPFRTFAPKEFLK